MQGNVLVLTSWSFNDALIQSYTLPYIGIIREKLRINHKIILVTSEQGGLALTAPELKEVNRKCSAHNMQLISMPYKRFGLKKLIAGSKELLQLYGLVRKEKVKIIHAFCTPAGSTGVFLSRLTGAYLIVDSYEPHADTMVENKTW